MNKKNWTQPNILVLGIQSTKEHKHTRSRWECSCNNKYDSIDSLFDHLKDFWNGNTGPGTSHTVTEFS